MIDGDRSIKIHLGPSEVKRGNLPRFYLLDADKHVRIFISYPPAIKPHIIKPSTSSSYVVESVMKLI